MHAVASHSWKIFSIDFPGGLRLISLAPKNTPRKCPQGWLLLFLPPAEYRLGGGIQNETPREMVQSRNTSALCFS